MGRPLRAAAGGLVYHVLNRANARLPLFAKDGDYAAFVKVLSEAVRRTDVPLLAYCVMPNHWHLLVCPRRDGDLTRFVGWLTLTHTQRWHAHHHSAGTGHLYQGRFKSFPVQDDEHFLTVCRYVERNALRAGLVARAEQWRWSSLWRRQYGGAADREILEEWPVAEPRDWLAVVNAPQNPAEEEALGRCLRRGQPYGQAGWVIETAGRLGLQATLRPQGRPRKEGGNGS